MCAQHLSLDLALGHSRYWASVFSVCRKIKRISELISIIANNNQGRKGGRKEGRRKEGRKEGRSKQMGLRGKISKTINEREIIQ